MIAYHYRTCFSTTPTINVTTTSYHGRIRPFVVLKVDSTDWDHSQQDIKHKRWQHRTASVLSRFSFISSLEHLPSWNQTEHFHKGINVLSLIRFIDNWVRDLVSKQPVLYQCRLYHCSSHLPDWMTRFSLWPCRVSQCHFWSDTAILSFDSSLREKCHLLIPLLSILGSQVPLNNTLEDFSCTHNSW